MPPQVLKVATLAKGHLQEARALQPRVPAEARAVMLPAVAADECLAALQASDFNPFDPRVQQPVAPLAHALRIKWHLFRGTY